MTKERGFAELGAPNTLPHRTRHHLGAVEETRRTRCPGDGRRGRAGELQTLGRRWSSLALCFTGLLGACHTSPHIAERGSPLVARGTKQPAAIDCSVSTLARVRRVALAECEAATFARFCAEPELKTALAKYARDTSTPAQGAMALTSDSDLVHKLALTICSEVLEFVPLQHLSVSIDLPRGELAEHIRVELDGALIFEQTFPEPHLQQSINVFNGDLVPGSHLIRIYAACESSARHIVLLAEQPLSPDGTWTRPGFIPISSASAPERCSAPSAQVAYSSCHVLFGVHGG